MGKPVWLELINAIDEAEVGLAPLVGRWNNGARGISGRARLELIKVRKPLMQILFRAGRRPFRPRKV